MRVSEIRCSVPGMVSGAPLVLKKYCDYWLLIRLLATVSLY